jgi:hypothetical protein
VLDTVFGVCVVQTLCWRSFVRTLLGTQSLEFASWNQELHSFASKRTLVHLAANGSNEPIVLIRFSRCMRSQRGKCCDRVKLGAAARRKNQPFVQSAARIRG